ncbi:hypothetical protein PR048_033119 [Dryococelus australis]|uniref:DUF4371 domain-containing protein n=1 Tax=Dryococelus australis TaxID=614101 RepID=A0ABQ9FZC5_9NEOP|nr:hypothetical protein PR048_033119 [Dryococelus australis]
MAFIAAGRVCISDPGVLSRQAERERAETAHELERPSSPVSAFLNFRTTVRLAHDYNPVVSALLAGTEVRYGVANSVFWSQETANSTVLVSTVQPHPTPLRVSPVPASHQQQLLLHAEMVMISNFAEGDESKVERQQRLLERARKAALNSSVIQELREEYLDTPVEVTHESSKRAVLSRERREREESSAARPGAAACRCPRSSGGADVGRSIDCYKIMLAWLLALQPEIDEGISDRGVSATWHGPTKRAQRMTLSVDRYKIILAGAGQPPAASAVITGSVRFVKAARYEETYFTRLPVTKQERHKSRKMTTLGTLGEELTRFGDIRALEGVAGPSSTPKKRRSSMAKKGKKGYTTRQARPPPTLPCAKSLKSARHWARPCVAKRHKAETLTRVFRLPHQPGQETRPTRSPRWQPTSFTYIRSNAAGLGVHSSQTLSREQNTTCTPIGTQSTDIHIRRLPVSSQPPSTKSLLETPLETPSCREGLQTQLWAYTSPPSDAHFHTIQGTVQGSLPQGYGIWMVLYPSPGSIALHRGLDFVCEKHTGSLCPSWVGASGDNPSLRPSSLLILLMMYAIWQYEDALGYSLHPAGSGPDLTYPGSIPPQDRVVPCWSAPCTRTGCIEFHSFLQSIMPRPITKRTEESAHTARYLPRPDSVQVSTDGELHVQVLKALPERNRTHLAWVENRETTSRLASLCYSFHLLWVLSSKPSLLPYKNSFTGRALVLCPNDLWMLTTSADLKATRLYHVKVWVHLTSNWPIPIGSDNLFSDTKTDIGPGGTTLLTWRQLYLTTSLLGIGLYPFPLALCRFLQLPPPSPSTRNPFRLIVPPLPFRFMRLKCRHCLYIVGWPREPRETSAGVVGRRDGGAQEERVAARSSVGEGEMPTKMENRTCVTLLTETNSLKRICQVYVNFSCLGFWHVDLDLNEQFCADVLKHNETADRNREVLKRVINVTVFLGLQELAFWGHDEREGSSNRGNYVELVNLLSSYDSVLSSHLETSKVFTRLSINIQNDIIECVAELIVIEIKAQIRLTPFVALLINEMTDIANMSQLSSVLREGSIEKRFLGFTDVSTARMANNVRSLNGLHKSKRIVRQCYVHCCSLKNITNCKIFLKTLSGFASFFFHSTKYTRALDKLASKRFAKVCPTRWNYSSRLVHTVFENKKALIALFDSITENPDEWDNDAHIAALQIHYFISFKQTFDVSYCIQKLKEAENITYKRDLFHIIWSVFQEEPPTKNKENQRKLIQNVATENCILK